MSIRSTIGSALLALLLPVAPVLAQTTLVTNVNGYTLNGQRELNRFFALQFTGDRVDRIFQAGEPLPSTDGITVLDGGGQTLIPGLIDAHGHVLSYGLSLLRVDLTGTTTEQEAAEPAKPAKKP